MRTHTNGGESSTIRHLLNELRQLPTGERNQRLAEIGLPAAQRRRLEQSLHVARSVANGRGSEPRVSSSGPASAATWVNPAIHPAPAALETAMCCPSSLTAGELPNQLRQIGRYRVLRVLGAGAMGVVYEAEQRTPVRRSVALKVVKLGMDSQEVLARFDAERQALAVMDHPNIAKVFDAGVTETGRPYFVMELVRGKPLNEYCDCRRYSTRQRLELFAQVCEAVQHAHTKAVIHRDLKPSNVLVAEIDGRAMPKVIDFGVAKATNQPLTDRTLCTRVGYMLGTPEYMSPEQADTHGGDVDTRADVYSLGVILYELLTGTLPLDPESLRLLGYGQLQRAIREVDPPRPSARVSSIAAVDDRVAERRNTVPQALSRELKRELEWIPLKAMRKEREERYRSAAELADDVRNYLAGRPLIAGPESWVYMAATFVRRHRALIAGGGLMLLLLIAGIAGTTLGMVRARGAERRATDALEASEQVRAFLVDTVGAANPNLSLGEAPRVTDLLDHASPQVDQRFAERPMVAAELHYTLARAYYSLGRLDRALPHTRRALALRQATLGEDHPLVVEVMGALGFWEFKAGNLAEALRLSQATYAKSQALWHGDDARTLDSYFIWCLVTEQKDARSAAAMLRDCLERYRRVHGPNHAETASVEMTLAGVLVDLGNPPETGELCRHALSILESEVGPKNSSTFWARHELARHLADYDPPEAERLARQCLSERRELLGPRHMVVATSLGLLGELLRDRGDDAAAVALFAEATDILLPTNGQADAHLTIVRSALVDVLARQGKLEEARRMGQANLDAALSRGQPTEIARARRAMAAVELRAGDPAAAEALARAAMEQLAHSLGLESKHAWDAQLLLAESLAALNREREARSLAEEVLGRCVSSFGADHVLAHRARTLLAQTVPVSE